MARLVIMWLQLSTWLLLLRAACVSSNQDLYVLLALKSSLTGRANVLSTWEIQAPNAPCTWQHVACLNNQVVSLDLSGYGLHGVLPIDIGELSLLNKLNMSGNNLIGDIPQEIGKLHQLHSLDLHSNSLNGSIPSSVAKLTNLVYLDLHNNSLGGSIPSTFVELTNLAYLDLAFNQLSGLIPSSGPFKRFSDSVFEGNKELHRKVEFHESLMAGRSTHLFKPSIIVIVIAISGAAALLTIAAFIMWWQKPKLFSQLLSEKSGINHEKNREHVKQYTLQEIRRATGNFCTRNVIGRGIYSIVYKGHIHDGTALVIKRLTHTGRKERKGLKEDVQIMTRAKHKNIATPVGICCTFRERILVYEHTSNGTLDAALHSYSGGAPLQWEKRKIIMLGVAKGLSYLHKMNPKIVHGGVKASNVLLQMDYMPKLADYCIGHLLDCSIQGQDFTKLQGHMSPDLLNACIPNTSSDCYSFGILLVEIVSGKRPWQFIKCAKEAQLGIAEWVCLEDLQTLVDMELHNPPVWEVQKILELAAHCMEMVPTSRPCMEDVVQFLIEEVLISNKSTELDGLFIELIKDPEQDELCLQKSPTLSMIDETLECTF